MKRQKKNPMLLIMLEALIAIALCILEIYICSCIFQYDRDTSIAWTVRAFLCTMSLYAVLAIYQHMSYKRYCSLKVKNELTSNPIEVSLKNSQSIDEMEFYCIAHKESNGKIHCTVTLNTEFEFDSTKDFLEVFHIDE